MPSQKIKKPQANGAEGATQTHPTIGSYFLSLELENVRCFSDKQTLDLTDGHGRPARWTILLGENGTGKTTILQLLAAFDRVCERLRRLSLHGEVDIEILEPAFTESLDGTVLDPNGPWPQFSIKAIHGLRFTGDTFHAKNNNYTIYYSKRHVLTICGKGLDPPTCYAFGTGRRLGASSLHRQEMGLVSKSVLFEDAMLFNAEEWLLRLDYSASKSSTIQEQQKKR